MIRVALAIESDRLRADVRAIVRASGRLQLEETTSDADVVVFDETASPATVQEAHAGGVAVVVLTDTADMTASFREARAALALLPSGATPEELVAAVEAVSAGLLVLHPELVSERVLAPAGVEALTARERVVLEALAAGLGNKAIAAQLDISQHTVKFHVSQILAKLGAGSRAEAVSIALRAGMLPL